MATMSACLVLCSGGQDSTTCLVWARSRYDKLYTVAFDYGQRHRVELDAAKTVAAMAGVTEHRVLGVEALATLGGNSLTSDSISVDEEAPSEGLPNSFVPGRNLLFLTLAAAWAYQLGVSDLVTGVCQTDYSGYPDCRESTMEALQAALRAGMDHPFTIHTPLMHLTKAETVHLCQDLGGMELLAHSHTCYNGEVPPCGHCPACTLRAKGFAEAGIIDPLISRLQGD